LPSYRGHIASPTCTGTDAIAAIKIAIAEAGRLGGKPLADLLPAPADTGAPVQIKLVTDYGPAFKGAAFAQFIACRHAPAPGPHRWARQAPDPGRPQRDADPGGCIRLLP
jgi:hypothetical protein